MIQKTLKMEMKMKKQGCCDVSWHWWKDAVDEERRIEREES